MARLAPTIDNLYHYDNWLALKDAHDRGQYKLANNTYVREFAGAYAVRYYNTDIVTFYPDNTVTLNTNGWHTTWTKRRLNELLNRYHVYIYQRDYTWYLQLGHNNNEETTTVEYEDGMTLDLTNYPPRCA